MDWNTIYKNNDIESSNSSFSDFCLKFMEPDNLIYDIGCGNARDTAFFNKKNMTVVGIDGSIEIINKNKEMYPDIPFYNSDVNDLHLLNLVDPKYVYCRFFIHSINEESCSNLLDWACDKLENNGKLFIECRSTKDNMRGAGQQISENEYINGHYRRFINKYEIVEQLHKRNMSIEYITESDNLSVSGTDNPVLIRIVAIKTSEYVLPRPNLYLIDMRDKLVDFIKACNDNDIEIFAVCGTLLGTIRCNGLIPWDTDIDIGILDKNLPKFLDFVSGLDYCISSNEKIDEKYKNYKISGYDIINNFNLDKELIWIYKNNFPHIQLNVMTDSDRLYKPLFWKNNATENFITHRERDLKIEYNSGRYNIPKSLFFPLIKHSFYDTHILIPNYGLEIVKLWYGENCLTHYPNFFLTCGDASRFTTSTIKINLIYAV